MRRLHGILPSCRLVLALLLTLLLAARAAVAAEEILDFTSRVQVQRDGALIVTETIRVRAEGRQIRRGIFRDFPLRFRRNDGGVGRVGFKVLKVLRDGQPENWFVQYPQAGVARIYIGRKEVMLPPGTYTYAITYRTTRQLRFFDDYDELYWNVTGSFWAFPIRRARVEVRLPASASILRHAVYTGKRGERGRDARVLRASDGHFVAESTRVLYPGEGFTVAAAFPKGVVAAPSSLQHWLWQLRDMAGLAWFVAGVALLTAYFLWAWWRYGRDPRPGVIVPRWEPPQAVSPAVAAALLQASHHMDGNRLRPFIAALVSLATKGYLKLEHDTGKYLTISRLKPADDTLPAGERVIMSELLGNKARLTLDRINGESLIPALRKFHKAVKAEHEETLLHANRIYIVIGAGLALLIGIGLLVLALRGAPMAIELLMVQLFVLLPAILLGNLLVEFLLSRRKLKLLANLVPAFLTLAFVLGSWFLLRDLMDMVGLSMPMLALVLLIPLLFVVFGRLLPRPTHAGRRVLDEIEGLRRFIETAEQRRLNQPGPDGAPAMSVPLFEKLLPWAIALDLEEPWTRALNKWLASAAAMGAGTAAHYSPAWYSGVSGHGIGNGLSDSFSSSLADSIAQAMPGRGSGIGGGGVGGGGGGGGGGGW